MTRNNRPSETDSRLKSVPIPGPRDGECDWPERPIESSNGAGEGVRGNGPDSERFEPLLDSPAAAKLLGIHPKTLQKLARVGRVPAHSICGLWRFRASELDRWLNTALSLRSHSRSN